jgi:hypothetical protein
MNKGTIIRASILFGVFLAIILVAVSCDTFDGEPVEAQISNPDETYLTIDGIEVTRQQLWDAMKPVDGLDYLFDLVEEQLLADYIAAVTQEEVDAEIRLLTYLTEDEELIADIMEDEDIHQDYLDAFRQNIIVLGFDPEDPASLRQFVELSIAKRNFTKEKVLNAIEEDDNLSVYYIADSEFENYYEDTRFGDVCSLDIRFQNTTEMDNVFNEFDLVPNFTNGDGDYGIGEYIDETTPIEDLTSKADFDDSNTILMSDSAVWSAYVEIYNYMNPWKDALDENITQEEYCTNYADDAVKNFEDIAKFARQGDPNLAFAQYIFNDLDLDNEDILPYTYQTNKVFGDYMVLVYKVSAEEVTPYADLTDEEKAELVDEVIEQSISDNLIQTAVDALLTENGFELYDPLFRLTYEFNTGITYDNDGSETIVAAYDGMEITADDLFDYLEGRMGAFYSLEVLKNQILLNSDDYLERYGDSYDYVNSNNENMAEHRSELRQMKSIFSSDGYAQYGYSSSAMTWDEFIYLAFGQETEADVIKNLYVINELTFNLAFNEVNYASGVAYMQEMIDTYFSLSVTHILIYVDMDFDFVPDDFEEFKEGLSPAELAEYETLRGEFEDLILEKINEGLTQDDIVTEYTETLMGDTESDWAPFKNFGFFMMSEQLGEIDHLTSSTLDDNFAAALKRMYDVYTREDNVEETVLNDDRYTESAFGVHFISVAKGQTFTQPSAEFEYNDEFPATDYSDGLENDSDLPSLRQVEVYLSILEQDQAGESPSEILPNSVRTAVSTYFGPIYDSYMGQTGVSIAVGNYALENGLTFTNNNAENKAQVEDLLAIFYEVNFPELFDKDAE